MARLPAKRPAPARRRANATDPRTAVLDAALRLTAERGFEAMALQDVADALGVTKQAVLYHFKSKNVLKAAIVDALLSRTNERFFSMMGTLGQSPLESVLEHLQRYLGEEPHAAQVMLRFILDQDRSAVDRIKVGVRPWLRAIEKLIEAGQRSGGVRAELDAEQVLTQVGSLVLANFAVLPLGGWGGERPTPAWQRARFEQLVRTIGLVLFTDAQRPPAFAQKSTPGRARR